MTQDVAEPVIETRAQGHVVGMARDFTMETRNQIPALFQAFLEARFDIPNALPGGIFGVSFSVDASGGFRYGVGVEVDPLSDDRPDGTCVMLLSGGEYAVLRAFGPVADLPARFDWLFTTWLPQAAVAQREGAVFEVYPEDVRNGPDGMAYEIWVPVTRKA